MSRSSRNVASHFQRAENAKHAPAAHGGNIEAGEFQSANWRALKHERIRAALGQGCPHRGLLRNKHEIKLGNAAAGSPRTIISSAGSGKKGGVKRDDPVVRRAGSTVHPLSLPRNINLDPGKSPQKRAGTVRYGFRFRWGARLR